MRKFLWISTDGKWAVADMTKETSYDLLKTGVGGYIEHVNIGVSIPGVRALDMWVNEEGKLNGLKPNTLGTILYGCFPLDAIVGDIVITGGVDGEGDTLGLTDKEVETLIGAFRLAPSTKTTWPAVN